MYRDAEKQLKSALKQSANCSVDIYLYLGKVYIKLDQPLAAIDNYKVGLEIYSNDAHLQTGIARVYEGLNDLETSTKFYKDVLHADAMNTEALASIATHFFYTDQPEVALKFFR